MSKAPEPSSTKATPRLPSYNAKELMQDIDAVRDVYANLGRGRLAIYGYWEAAYKLRRKWRRLQRRGLKLKRIARQAINGMVPPSSGDDLLRLIIDLTIAPTVQSPTADITLSKLKSKYFSLLNFAYHKRVKTGDLIEFVQQVGGLNYSARRGSTK
jgi:hypothetical protein